MSVHATNSNSHIVAHNLSTNHSQCLTLCWIDLSWHDTGSRFILRQHKLAQTRSWPTSQESYVVSYFAQTNRHSIKSPVVFHQPIFSGQWFKFIFSRSECVPRLFWNSFSNLFSKSNIGVKSRANSSSSLCNLVDVLKGFLNSLDWFFNLMGISTELLA